MMLRWIPKGDEQRSNRSLSSSKSSQGEVTLPPHFQEVFRLMKKGKWEKAHKCLKAKRKKMSQIVDSSGLTVLALALSFQAPEFIIREILQADPESPTKVDSFGATPLHLACLNGTTPEIVRLILDHDNGASARAVDRGNYSVLHHAVEYICLLIEKRHTRSQDTYSESIESEHDDYLEIIKLICSKAPQTVHYKTNDDGDTPLDIPNIIMLKHTKINPHMQERLLEVYQLLKRVSISVYRQRKKAWEGAKRDSNVAEDCGGSIPSMVSSNASSSAVSRSLSLFKDSVTGSSTQTGADVKL